MPLRRDLLARFLGDNKDLRQKMGQVAQDTQSLDKRVGNFGSAARKAFGIVGVAAAAHFGRQLFNVGVEAAAFERRFDTVFGSAGSGLASKLDGMNERFGVSETRMKGLAAAAGDLLVPMGFTRAAAGDMSIEILNTANALSEWTGGQRSAAEVADIISKAILGEREALKGLGVSILEADVNARVAANGMVGLTGQAREQARAQATLEIITAKSADALIAYAEGGTDAERASKAAAAAIDELKVTAGELVVQAAPLVQVLADLLGALDSIPGGSAAALGGLLGFAVAGPLGAAVGGALAFVSSMKTVADQLKEIEVGFAAARIDANDYGIDLENLTVGSLSEAAEGFERLERQLAATHQELIDSGEGVERARRAWDRFLNPLRAVAAAEEDVNVRLARMSQAHEDSSSRILTAAGITQEGLRETYLRISGDIEGAISSHAAAAADILSIWAGVPEGIDDVDIEGALASALEVAQLQQTFAADMQTLTVAGFGALVDEINRNPNKAQAVRLMDHFANDLGAALTFSEQAGISLDEWVTAMERSLAQRDKFRGINDTMYQQGVTAGESWLAGARQGASGPLGFPTGDPTDGQRRRTQRSGSALLE